MAIALQYSQPAIPYLPSGPDRSGRSGDRLTSTYGRREQDLTFSEGKTGEQLPGMFGESGKPPVIEAPKLKGNSGVMIDRAMRALSASGDLLNQTNLSQINSKQVVADEQGKAQLERINYAIREAPFRSPDLLSWLGNFFVQIGVALGSAIVTAFTTGDVLGALATGAGAIIGGISAGLYEFVLKPFVEGPLVNFLVDTGIMNRAEAQVFANTLVLGTLVALTVAATAIASICLVVFAGAPPTVVLGAVYGVTAGLNAGIISPSVVKSLVSFAAGVAGAVSTGGISLSGNAVDIVGGIIDSCKSGSLKPLADSVFNEDLFNQASLLFSGFGKATAAAVNGMGAVCKAANGDSTELDAINRNVDTAKTKQDDYYANQSKASGETFSKAGDDIVKGFNAVVDFGEDAVTWVSGGAIQFA
jgi:hypothetical protein